MSAWRTRKVTAPPAPSPPRSESGERRPPTPPPQKHVAHIGASIRIKGDLSGAEDLVLDGRVEGRVQLGGHHLTIGPDGHHVQAELSARALTIHGHVAGNVSATERVEIGATGALEGDVVAPRLVIREGAQFNGRVTMPSTPGGGSG